MKLHTYTNGAMSGRLEFEEELMWEGVLVDGKVVKGKALKWGKSCLVLGADKGRSYLRFEALCFEKVPDGEWERVERRSSVSLTPEMVRELKDGMSEMGF
jgi:hypothetical protein